MDGSDVSLLLSLYFYYKQLNLVNGRISFRRYLFLIHKVSSRWTAGGG
jgi:hypothetical protein